MTMGLCLSFLGAATPGLNVSTQNPMVEAIGMVQFGGVGYEKRAERENQLVTVEGKTTRLAKTHHRQPGISKRKIEKNSIGSENQFVFTK